MKKLTALSVTIAGYLSFALPTYAANIDICPPTGLGFRTLCRVDFANLVTKLIQVAFVIAVIIALAFLIFGGIRWITSGGDKAGVEAARNTIVASLVGLVIVFLSFFILNTLLVFFTGNSIISGLRLPNL